MASWYGRGVASAWICLALASALGWTLVRTFIALDHVDASLDAAAQRLRWIHDGYVGICATDS